MTYVFTIEDRKRSPNFGKEVMKAATILETPPLLVCGIRTYTHNPVWTPATDRMLDEESAQKNFERTLVLPENFNTEENAPENSMKALTKQLISEP